jgi:hypothetical protein
MILLGNIIADIKSDLKSYDESNLIDDVSLSLHLLNQLKEFGGNVMQTYPTVIEIHNGQGKLPNNFFSLVKAVKTEPIGYLPDNDCLQDELIGSSFYRVKKEASKIWNNFSHTFENGAEYKEVTEQVFEYNKGLKAKFYYGNNKSLKLVRGFDKSKLDVRCENIRVKESPYEISIINNTLQTNFTKGAVCIWYQGLLVDEETEDIVLPEDPNANIYKYLIATGKAKVFELLWANNDDENVVNKLQFYKAEARENKTLALAQVRMSSVVGDNWSDGIKIRQRNRISIYNLRR